MGPTLCSGARTRRRPRRRAWLLCQGGRQASKEKRGPAHSPIRSPLQPHLCWKLPSGRGSLPMERRCGPAPPASVRASLDSTPTCTGQAVRNTLLPMLPGPGAPTTRWCPPRWAPSQGCVPRQGGVSEVTLRAVLPKAGLAYTKHTHRLSALTAAHEQVPVARNGMQVCPPRNVLRMPSKLFHAPLTGGPACWTLLSVPGRAGCTPRVQDSGFRRASVTPRGWTRSCSAWARVSFHAAHRVGEAGSHGRHAPCLVGACTPAPAPLGSSGLLRVCSAVCPPSRCGGLSGMWGWAWALWGFLPALASPLVLSAGFS